MEAWQEEQNLMLVIVQAARRVVDQTEEAAVIKAIGITNFKSAFFPLESEYDEISVELKLGFISWICLCVQLKLYTVNLMWIVNCEF